VDGPAVPGEAPGQAQEQKDSEPPHETFHGTSKNFERVFKKVKTNQKFKILYLFSAFLCEILGALSVQSLSWHGSLGE
jgi:hypothetical protein